MGIFKTIYNKVFNRVALKYCSYKDFILSPHRYDNNNQHVVIFESDDWGSIRMSTRKDWEALLSHGYAVDRRPYERYDTLESAEDVEALFEVLSRHNDAKGNHPVFTANMLMVNPDFAHIEKNSFQSYEYEPISKTYTRYFGDAKVLDVMRQGMYCGLFMPQSHGREHFNVAKWMRGLQEGDEDLLMAFRYGMCGIAPKAHPEQGNQLMNALRAENELEQHSVDAIVKEGLGLFEQMWGFKSETFVAPCYCWNGRTEKVLAECGVKLMQTSRVAKSAYRTSQRFLYAGQRSTSGIRYSVRNCHFEPSTIAADRRVEGLMSQIDSIFAQHKLAIFSTHRINYVSGIDEDNRTRTLVLLDAFLTQLLKKYPDVVFISSDKVFNILQ